MNLIRADWPSTQAMLPHAVSIREVGPRDGLQSEDPISTAEKIRMIEALSHTGLPRIEAVSFVHPKAIPQMADAKEVWSTVAVNDSVTYSALAPNLVGAKRALQSGFADIEVVVSASDTHNRNNIRRSTDESLDELAELIEVVHRDKAEIEVIIATSFGCPFEGDVPVSRVGSIVDRVLSDGADRVAFGDTTGMATPRRVGELLDVVKGAHPDVPLLLHFHNTRGTALANVLMALGYGVTEFDASVGGLGGCPYAPGASGNLATEELVHMLHDMGIDTGVDLEALLEVAEMAEKMVGRTLPSGVLRAGPRSRRSTL